MKISIIEPIGGHGGLEIYDLGVCGALIEAGCNVSIYTGEKMKDIDCWPTLNVYRSFGKMFDARYGRFVRFALFIKGLYSTCKGIRNERSEIVYLHIFHFSVVELLILIMSFLLPSKIYVNIHDPVSFGAKPNAFVNFIFSRLLSNQHVRVTTHTQYSKSIITQLYPHLNVSIMPHSDIDFIHSARLSKSECKTKLELDTKFEYVLFFGQIKSTKGLDTLLRAWRYIVDAHSTTRLLIVGRCWKNDCSVYRKIINDNGVSDSIEWREVYVDDSDVPYYFGASAAVVLPYTRIYSSGVLLRAIGYGTPVILSDQPAFTEVVEHNNSAIVFRTGDEMDLADKLKTALGDKRLLEKLSQNASKLIKEKHSWEFVGKEMHRIFRDAIIEN